LRIVVLRQPAVPTRGADVGTAGQRRTQFEWRGRLCPPYGPSPIFSHVFRGMTRGLPGSGANPSGRKAGPVPAPATPAKKSPGRNRGFPIWHSVRMDQNL
jgi:hypothetical protein